MSRKDSYDPQETWGFIRLCLHNSRLQYPDSDRSMLTYHAAHRREYSLLREGDPMKLGQVMPGMGYGLPCDSAPMGRIEHKGQGLLVLSFDRKEIETWLAKRDRMVSLLFR